MVVHSWSVVRILAGRVSTPIPAERAPTGLETEAPAVAVAEDVAAAAGPVAA